MKISGKSVLITGNTVIVTGRNAPAPSDILLQQLP